MQINGKKNKHHAYKSNAKNRIPEEKRGFAQHKQLLLRVLNSICGILSAIIFIGAVWLSYQDSSTEIVRYVCAGVSGITVFWLPMCFLNAFVWLDFIDYPAIRLLSYQLTGGIVIVLVYILRSYINQLLS